MNKNYPYRFVRLIFGLFLCACSLAFGVYSTLGLAPWNVFAEGISIHAGITMGRASQIIGFVILFLDYFLKEPIGVGSILNMILVGFFLDQIMIYGIIPELAPEQMFLRIVYLILCMVVYAFGAFLYIGAGMGSGPRDGLMVALAKRAKGFSVGAVKVANDVVVTFAGFLLGGLVGIGTLVNAIGTGYALQIVFKFCKFDIKGVEHEYATETVKNLFKKKTETVVK